MEGSNQLLAEAWSRCDTAVICVFLTFTDGKSKLSESPAAFNKAASEQYRKLSSDEKESLKEKVKEVKMTKHEVIKSGRKFSRRFNQL